MTEGEIDLGVWFRYIVLGAILIFLAASGIKIGGASWEQWNVGNEKHQQALRTLKRCASGNLDDTSHFQDACTTAKRDRAKDPFIYAIEHTWKELWPCKSAMCLEVLVHITRSMWTIVVAALGLTFVVLYFTGCSGVRPATPQAMYFTGCSPTAHHGYSKAVTVDIGTMAQHKQD